MNLIETVSNDSYNFTNLGLDTCSCRDDDDVQSLFISIRLQFHHILVTFYFDPFTISPHFSNFL